MAATSLICPECDTPLRLKTEPPPGKSVRCGACKVVFRVPGVQPAQPPKQAPPTRGVPEVDEVEAVEEIEEVKEKRGIKPAPAAKQRKAVDDIEEIDEIDEIEAVTNAPKPRKAKADAGKAVTFSPKPRPSGKKDDEDEEAAEEKAPKKKGPKKKGADAEGPTAKKSNMAVILAAGGLLLLVGGGLTFFLTRSSDPKPVAKKPGDEQPKDGTAKDKDGPPKDAPPKDGPPKDAPPKDGKPKDKPPEDIFLAKPPAPEALAKWLEAGEGDIPAPLPDGPDRPRLVLDTGGHTASLFSAAISADGKFVVTCGLDKTARLWDVATGRTINTFRLPAGDGNDGALYATAISPDGKVLAVAGLAPDSGRDGNPIYLIDLPEGKTLRPLKGHKDAVTCLAFSPSGKSLASGSIDTTVRVFNVESGKETLLLGGHHKERIRRLAWSPEGKTIATASTDGAALWSVGFATPRAVFRLPDPRFDNRFLAVAFSPKGTRIATTGEDGALRVWDTKGKQISAVALGPSPEQKLIAVSIAFMPGGNEIVYGGTGGAALGGTAGIVDVKTGKHRAVIDKHSNTVMDARLSADCSLCVTAGGDGNEAHVWRTRDGSHVQTLAGPGKAIYGVGWSLDGKTIAWGTTNRDVAVGKAPLDRMMRLDFLSGPKPVRREDEWERAREDVGPYTIQRDPAANAVQGLNSGRPLFRWSPPSAAEKITCFSMVPGRRAVVGTAYGAYLIDFRTGKTIRKFVGPAGAINCIAVTFKGREREFFFLTGSADQTISIWTPEKENPLVTIFVAGNEWAAWTNEGVYACSSAGERLMGWQMGRGSRQLAEFLPAALFRKALYHPDVVRYVVPEGSLQRALLRTGKGRLMTGGTVSVTQVLPPEVQIISPAADAKSPTGEMTIEAEARSVGGNPVTRMRLIVDGRPWDGDRGIRPVEPPKAGKVKASWKVVLQPGPHVINVMAESTVSRSMSPELHVTNTSPIPTTSPVLYILAIGVSDYPKPDQKLNFAASDANLLTRTFKERHGGAFSKVEVRLLMDKDATKQKIGEGLRWMSDVMTDKDIGLVFFSGHGIRDEKGDFCLVPVDVDDRDPGKTCVSGEAVKRIMGNMRGRLIFMMDSCHSGAAAERGGADDLARELMTEDYGILVISSSMGDEYSLESSRIKAGFFTKAFTDGMRGEADLNRDGVIELGEIEVYTAMQVSRETGGRQNPVSGRPPTFQPFPVVRLRR